MRKKTLLSTVALVFALTAVAVAYYFVAGLGEGEGKAKLGKTGAPAATYPITLAFADGLMPGVKEAVAVTFENNTGHATDVKHLAITPSTSPGTCQIAWFTITAAEPGQLEEVLKGTATTGIALPVGTHTLSSIDGFNEVELLFKEEAAVNQNACSEATITLKAVATP